MSISEKETRRAAPSILFICSANICRSPMAAALFLARLKQVDPDWLDWQVDSAGTWAVNGEPAARNSQEVMNRRGLDISQHRSRQVTKEMLEVYDLILTMELGHKEALQNEFPTVASRVFMLSEMEGIATTISDPYGQSVETYEKTSQKIDQILSKSMPRIQELVKGRQIDSEK